MDDSTYLPNYVTIDYSDYSTAPLSTTSLLGLLCDGVALSDHSNPAALYHTSAIESLIDTPNEFLDLDTVDVFQSTAISETDVADQSSQINLLKDNVVRKIIGKKGGEQICLNGYLYTHDRKKTLSDGRINRYWQCIERRNLKCGARLITTSDDTPSVVKEPEHPKHQPEPTMIDVATVKSRLKEQATSDEATGSVVRHAYLDMDPAVLANLPTTENMKRSVRRERTKQNHHPTNPSSAADVVIPPHYTTDNAGNRFLLSDKTTPSGKRVIIYCSDSSLEALQSPENTVCFLDGTFKTSPIHFTQNLVVRTKVGSNIIPAAYCLLEDKSGTSYKLALDELKSAAPLWNPSGIVLDFETAELNAVNQTFPTCWKHGCHFHYCQCLMRRFKKVLGYTTVQPMRDLLDRTYVLPFLPPDDVSAGWLDIKQQLLNTYPVTSHFVDYFENNWMNGPNYDIPFWNCYQQTLDGHPRTNNAAEGGNNSLRVAFGCTKPVIWKWLDKIKEIQSQTDLVLVQHMTGQSNSVPVRKRWMTRERCIKRIVEEYDSSSSDKMMYLSRLSRHFSVKA